MDTVKFLNEYVQSNIDKTEELKSRIYQIIKDYDQTTEKYKSCDMDYLIEKISPDILNEACKCIEKGYEADSYIQNLSDERIAVVLVSMLDFMKKSYEREKIDEKVFFQTISDLIFRISDYKLRNGKYGLEGFEGKWLLRMFYLNIFKLGSLQFETGRINLDEMKMKQEDLKEFEDIVNKDVIMVHIMENEDISRESCEESFGFADEFFSDEYKYYVCYSWLLYENMRGILKQSSKILQFQNLFEKIINIDDSSMAKERIYKNHDKNNETSLQKNMKLHPECMGVGFGIKDAYL